MIKQFQTFHLMTSEKQKSVKKLGLTRLRGVCSVVVITSGYHAEGPQFDPWWKLFLLFFLFLPVFCQKSF